MFDTILQMPLLQGLSHDDIAEIVGHNRLDFDSVGAGMSFIRQGESCNGLHFVISGEVQCTRTSSQGNWFLTEELDAPLAIELDVLYGRQRCYRHTWTAKTNVRLMSMDKMAVARVTARYEVFRLNVLNALDTLVSALDDILWTPPATATVRQQIVYFMHRHVSTPCGRKVFTITTDTLSKYVGKGRRYVGMALHSLEDEELLSYTPGTIDVPDFQRLLSIS